MPRFLLVHGLPGAGKTSLCRALESALSGTRYVDLRASEWFKKRPMSQICCETYVRESKGLDLITEGVLSGRTSRDKFVDQVINGIKNSSGINFDVQLIVFLEECVESLSGRRRRSQDEYEALLENVEYGSKHFRYLKYPAAGKTISERVEEVKRIWEGN